MQKCHAVNETANRKDSGKSTFCVSNTSNENMDFSDRCQESCCALQNIVGPCIFSFGMTPLSFFQRHAPPFPKSYRAVQYSYSGDTAKPQMYLQCMFLLLQSTRCLRFLNSDQLPLQVILTFYQNEYPSEWHRKQR